MTRIPLRAAVAGAFALLLVAVLGVAMSRGVGQDQLGVVDPRVEAAPEFSLPKFDGSTFTLSDHADRPVFLYFRASWCLPCLREAPLLERLWPEYRARGYTFVGVNVLDREADARQFVDRYGITFPLVNGSSSTVYLEYGVYGMPEAFFIAPGLTVRDKFVGELGEERFRDLLDGLTRARP